LALIWHFLFQDLALESPKNLATLFRFRLVFIRFLIGNGQAGRRALPHPRLPLAAAAANVAPADPAPAASALRDLESDR